jgi:hypothetical protein
MVTYISFSSCGVYKLPLMYLFVFITLSLVRFTALSAGSGDSFSDARYLIVYADRLISRIMLSTLLRSINVGYFICYDPCVVFRSLSWFNFIR